MSPPGPSGGDLLAGRYHILEEIGRGGMGIVYRARDERLAREVAVKMLPASAGEAHGPSRFRNEALALSQLNHPNIATVFDFVDEQDAPFLVMELVTGTTLETGAAGALLSPARVLTIGRQLAAGLAAAHERGISSRSETGESEGHARRAAQDPGLRSGEARSAHRHRRHDIGDPGCGRDAAVYGAGTAARGAMRSAHGHLGCRSRAL
jgi:hypothetical protein